MRIGLVLSIFFLIGCMPPPGGYGPGGYGNNYYGGASTGAPGNPPPQPRTDEEYEARKANENRQAVLDRAKRNGREDPCEDEDKDHKCWDQCKEMYHRSSDREECRELPTDQIEKILEVYKNLKKPSKDKLADIDMEDLELYLETSIAGFDRLVEDYRSDHVEDVFYWVADDEDVAELIKGVDGDYRILDTLLSEIRGYDSDNLEKAFLNNDVGDKDHTILGMAIYRGNEEAVEYFFDYILEMHKYCREGKEHTIHCFTEICKIGKELTDRNRQDFLDYSIFASYIDDIIDDGVNSAQTGNHAAGNKWCKGTTNTHSDCTSQTNLKKQITDIDDLGSDWTADGANKGLCGGLG